MNGKDYEHERLVERNGKLYDAAWKSAFLSGMMMPLMTFIGTSPTSSSASSVVHWPCPAQSVSAPSLPS